MESAPWNLLDGTCSMESARWSLLHGICSMESAQCNLLNGVCSIESAHGLFYAIGRLGDNHLQKVSSQTSFRYELGLSKASFHLQPFITHSDNIFPLLQRFRCLVLFVANMLFIANVSLLYLGKSFLPSSMKTQKLPTSLIISSSICSSH